MTADAEKERAERWKASAESGDALLGAVIEAMGSRPDRDPVLAARELVAERDALKARIKAAPHSRFCQIKWSAFTVEDLSRPCNCWKSDDLIEDQPEPSGRWCQDPHPEHEGVTYAPVHFHPAARPASTDKESS